MYTKKQRNWNGRGSRPQKRDYMDETQHHYDGRPGTGDIHVKMGLAAKALRDMPHSSYSVKADPYTDALPTSQPYPIVNVFNKHVGGQYAGDKNIDGGNVSQYANSVSSRFLKAFDVMRMEIKLNYRYLPITPRTLNNADIGKELVNEMRKSIAEAMSTLQSTTYTQMAINRFAVVTDLPMGDAVTRNIAPTGATEVQAYTSSTDVFYAMSIFYQIFLLEIANTMNWHNSFRLKQGEMIRNAWNREVPILNSLFGLFNKKAFLNKLESINLSFEGEYLDTDFLKQAAMLNVMPSRRSESILDPVLELQTTFNHPTTFKVFLLDDDGHYVGTGPFFDMDNLAAEIPIGEHGANVRKTVWEAVEAISDTLSMEATTRWARTENASGYLTETENYRYNLVLKYFDVLMYSFNYFKPLWSDYREALDTMVRAGIVRWTKGFRPSITRSTSAPLFQNMIVDDIYKFVLGGAEKLTYDDATKRWRTFSMWDMYKGIPEYDTYAGGCFLTFSFKTLDVSSDSDANKKYLPILFEKGTIGTAGNVKCAAVARDGKEAAIETSVITMSQSIPFMRLAPLSSQDGLQIRVPVVKTATNPTLSDAHLSLIEKALAQIVGFSATLKNTTWNYTVDPDILAIYQVEIEDITNMSITYARAMGPIRGTTSDEGVLGFFGMRKGTKYGSET